MQNWCVQSHTYMCYMPLHHISLPLPLRYTIVISLRVATFSAIMQHSSSENANWSKLTGWASKPLRILAFFGHNTTTIWGTHPWWQELVCAKITWNINKFLHVPLPRLVYYVYINVTFIVLYCDVHSVDLHFYICGAFCGVHQSEIKLYIIHMRVN